MSSNIQVFLPNLATAIGLEESIVIQQILYWVKKCGKTVNNLQEEWIYNTIETWHQQFSYWSLSKLRRIFSSLEQKELIFSKKVNAKKWNQTKWYSVNRNKICQILGYDFEESISNHSEKKALSTTQKNTKNHSQKIKLHDTQVSHDNQFSDTTNRFAQNEQMYKTENNYTYNISSVEKDPLMIITKLEEDKTSVKNIAPLNTTHEQRISIKMIEIWNQSFQYSLRPIKAYCSGKIQKKLVNLFISHFNQDFNCWLQYCEMAQRSKFLMGEKETKNGFKATFSWLLQEETVNKILGQEYGIGDRELDRYHIPENIQKLQEEVLQGSIDPLLAQVHSTVNQTYEERNFKKYIMNEEYERDGDQYGVEYAVRQFGKYNLVHQLSGQGSYKLLYDSYVLKNNIGKNVLEIRALLREKISKVIEESGSSTSILQGLKRLHQTLHGSKGVADMMRNIMAGESFLGKWLISGEGVA